MRNIPKKIKILFIIYFILIIPFSLSLAYVCSQTLQVKNKRAETKTELKKHDKTIKKEKDTEEELESTTANKQEPEENTTEEEIKEPEPAEKYVRREAASTQVATTEEKATATTELPHKEPQSELDKSVIEFRSQLKNRNPNFTISLSYSDTDIKKLANYLYEEAVRHTGKGDEGDYLTNHIVKCHIDGTKTTTTGNHFDYVYTITADYSDTIDQESEISAALNFQEENLGLSNLNEADRARAIYDFIIDRVEYENYGEEAYTAYGALINRRAVCQGYALLFYRMALDAGLDTRIVSGTGKTEDTAEPHAWNIVKVDGKFYNIDVTWGEADRDRFFLANTQDFEESHIRDDQQ